MGLKILTRDLLPASVKNTVRRIQLRGSLKFSFYLREDPVRKVKIRSIILLKTGPAKKIKAIR